ncbi:hypothetical protein [Sphingobacterium yanglingense]|uniref:hypothetical protein n=1 Tax=Sphingobacterium yanglingense TaxID=1437280 RepID=UPI001060A7D8|nr:hypothetical protein [Sphingobacterium yanglingense]
MGDLRHNRNQDEHYYIAVDPRVGHPDFRNEKLYSDIPYPDDGYRLLTLFRYSNMIQYFFPYKYLTDKNWNIVLKEYIPLFISAKNELEYELAPLRIIGDVNDIEFKPTISGIRAGKDEVLEKAIELIQNR